MLCSQVRDISFCDICCRKRACAPGRCVMSLLFECDAFLKTRVIHSGLIAQDQIHGSGMQVFDVCMGMCVGGEWVDGGSWAGSASIFRSCV